jgi:hypothetical protein
MAFPDRQPIYSTILYDENGNPVGVVLDGYDTIYRIQAETVIVGKDPATGGPNEEVTVIDDSTNANIKRLQVEADIKPGATIGIGANTLNSIVSRFLTDDGTDTGSEDMVVDGDPTPVTFTFPADATDDIFLNELRLVFSSTSMIFDGTKFSKSSALANGILIEATINDGTAVDLINVTINEDFLRFVTSSGINLFSEFSGTNDVLTASFQFSGREKLAAGSADEIKITIRDDFTNIGAYGVNYLTATFYGFMEEA